MLDTSVQALWIHFLHCLDGVGDTRTLTRVFYSILHPGSKDETRARARVKLAKTRQCDTR